MRNPIQGCMTVRFRAGSVALIASIGALGCSSDGSPSSEPGGDPEAEAPEVYLGLEVPEDGFQVRNVGTTIAAGADVEFCEVAELPGDPTETYVVQAAEFANADYSHHLIVTAAVPGSPADQRLREMEIGERVPCVSAEIAFGEDGIIGIGGTQDRSVRIEYPEGVGREYHGGQRVVFDYHYYNVTSEPVEARSAFNLHLAEPGDVTQLAGTFAFTNWLIETPPGGTASFMGECRFDDDVEVAALTRHTHRWGTDYSVWFAGGDKDGEHIWTSDDFQHDVNHSFDAPIHMSAGEGFRFECTYDNTEEHPLRFGVNATDEMCILFGLFWDGGGAREAPSQDCNIVYTDEGGVGQAVGPDGFPPPPPELVDACIAGGTPEGEAADPCVSCQCTACAEVLINCFTDAHCGPILECVQTDGVEACQDALDEHSPGLGLLQQVSECSQASSCADVCGGESL